MNVAASIHLTAPPDAPVPPTPPVPPVPPTPPVPSGGGGPLSVIGDSIGGMLSTALDQAMKAVWEAAIWVLRTALQVVDVFSTFTVDQHSGPIGAVWPTLLAVSGAIALGLFFWQITMAALRGGRGMMRAATGPVAYGVALAMTITGIAAMLATADGLTAVILSQGLKAANFSAAFTSTSLGGQVINGVKPVALGLIGFFGLLPAAIGWVLEIIWRQAAILVLVATVPITAAGLLAQTTSSWFWRGLRWTIAAIAVKPVLALIVVIGVSSLAGAEGPIGLLAGIGVLWVALACPIALFRLLAFVEPGTNAGQIFRDSFAQATSRLSGGSGFDSSGGATSSGGSSGGGDAYSEVSSAFESANTARFDAAGVGAGSAGGTGGQDTPPPPPSSGYADGGASSVPAGGGSTPGSTSGAGGSGDSGYSDSSGSAAAPGYEAQPVAASSTGGQSGGESGGQGGAGARGAGGRAAGGAVDAEAVETAAVIL